MGQDQNGTGDAGDIDQAPTDEQPPSDKLIRLHELLDELPVGLARKGQEVVQPPIQQLLSLQVLFIPQVEEEIEPDPEVAFRPGSAREQPDLMPYPVSRDVADSIDEAIDILALEPLVKKHRLREADRKLLLGGRRLAHRLWRVRPSGTRGPGGGNMPRLRVECQAASCPSEG